jgi:hypothetical protein
MKKAREDRSNTGGFLWLKEKRHLFVEHKKQALKVKVLF